VSGEIRSSDAVGKGWGGESPGGPVRGAWEAEEDGKACGSG
jgi:hypothetical protein